MDYKTLYIIMEYNVLIAGSALVVWTELPQNYAPNSVLSNRTDSLGHNMVGYE